MRTMVELRQTASANERWHVWFGQVRPEGGGLAVVYGDVCRLGGFHQPWVRVCPVPFLNTLGFRAPDGSSAPCSESQLHSSHVSRYYR